MGALLAGAGDEIEVERLPHVEAGRCFRPGAYLLLSSGRRWLGETREYEQLWHIAAQFRSGGDEAEKALPPGLRRGCLALFASVLAGTWSCTGGRFQQVVLVAIDGSRILAEIAARVEAAGQLVPLTGFDGFKVHGRYFGDPGHLAQRQTAAIAEGGERSWTELDSTAFHIKPSLEGIERKSHPEKA